MLHSEIMSLVSPLLNMAAVQQIIRFSRKQEYVTFKNIIISVFVLSLLFSEQNRLKIQIYDKQIWSSV